MLAIVLLSLVIGLTVIFVISWAKNYRWRKTIDLIPGPPALPFVGNALMLEQDAAEFYRQRLRFAKEYASESGLYRLWIGSEPLVMICKAEHVEKLVNSSKHMSKSYFYNFLRPWLNDGLLLSTGEKWHKRRRMITPTFHFKILEEFLKVFNEQAAILVGHLEKKVDGEEFDIHPYLTYCTLDIICETAMGQNVNAQGDSESEYVKGLKKILSCIMNRMKFPWLWPDALLALSSLGRQQRECLKSLHGLTQRVIRERAEEFDNQKEHINSLIGDDARIVEQTGDAIGSYAKRKRLAFLDMLLAAAKSDPTINYDDIQEEVDTFMFEGHDTTSSAATWAVFTLATHPVVQKRLQEEADQFITDDEPITMDVMNKLIYTECFLKEVLRHYPPVFDNGRTTSEDCVMGDYTLPKGVSTSILVECIHRDPENFPNPNEFDPDRWLSDKASGRNAFAYIPFSAGLRNCIGQKFAMLEEKVLISRIVKHFNVTCSQVDDGKLTAGVIILKPATGIFVRLSKRA